MFDVLISSELLKLGIKISEARNQCDFASKHICQAQVRIAT
jgi:hypothetical protein